ncbi:gluconate 2-dehydrogenase subunit 3 family protein [Egicoccus halophilus]|uniref:gluconate 2-dehydrogenase subunit 3 family protein n=1 Tax=Egicoccus halophilus TaxID=1670830 RepID=UPI0013EE53D1|nr:gluconate 2-dehydrogenase subunit 3 family protein [Egicoccus halophilus]
MSRRSFLAVTGTLATAAVVPGCTTDRGAVDQVPREGPSAVPQPGVQVPEATGAATRFLNPDQYAILEAIAARIIPGDEDDPGAVQAGCVDYIDRLLATHEGYPERTYTMGPFARGYEGDEEPPAEDGIIWVPADELERYGWQAGQTPRDLYRMGLARFQELVAARHAGASFVDLSEDEQDAILEAIEDNEDDDVDEIFDPLPADTFFDLVHGHVVEGFLADPMYGGNQDMVGWRLVGFPGAQRAYSPEEMLDPNFNRPPQSLAMLPMLHGAHRDDTQALGSVRRRHPNGPID